MNKQKAIELLGGSVATTAKAVGISYQAVNKWPDNLPSRIEDRVVAALTRMQDVMKPRLNAVVVGSVRTQRRSKDSRTDDRRAKAI